MTSSCRFVAWFAAAALPLFGLPLLAAPTAAATPTCFGKTATIVGTAGNDTRTGTAGADVIVGLGGNDTIHGGGGNDLICGGAGNDALYGDGGANKLDGQDGDDTLVGSATAADTLTGGAGAYDIALYSDLPATTPLTASLATGLATAGAVTDHLSGVEGVVGTPGADKLTGGPGTDLLFGVGGSDVIDGAGGFDYAGFLVAPVTASLTTGSATGEGTDVLKNTEGLLASYSPSTLTGDAKANLLLGASGSDVLHGAGNDDVLAGGTGSDKLYGDAGNDRLQGGGGDDQLVGGTGFDLADYTTATGAVTVNLATNRSAGDQGVDVLSQVEDVAGGPYNDTLTGNSTGNRLLGLAGNDTLAGLGGDDLLVGGDGSDVSNGGTGNDNCQSTEAATACEKTTTTLAANSGASLGTSAPTSRLRAVAASVQITNRAYRVVDVYCDSILYAEMQISPPQVVSIAPSSTEGIQWTPYIYQYDFATGTWDNPGIGNTTNLIATPNGDSGGSYLSVAPGTQTEYILQSGYYQVADYIYWPQYDYYTWAWAGDHITAPDGGIIESRTYAPYCGFNVGGAAAAKSAPLPALTSAPPQLPTTARRLRPQSTRRSEPLPRAVRGQ